MSARSTTRPPSTPLSRPSSLHACRASKHSQTRSPDGPKASRVRPPHPWAVGSSAASQPPWPPWTAPTPRQEQARPRAAAGAARVTAPDAPTTPLLALSSVTRRKAETVGSGEVGFEVFDPTHPDHEHAWTDDIGGGQVCVGCREKQPAPVP